MGKGRPRAVEKGGLGLGQNLCLPSTSSSSSLNGSSLHVPPAPVYYPNEEEFKDPIEYIDSIRAEAEPYGICRIVPPKNWTPPFALNLETFRFPTKTQAIHQLQVRAASCDGKTFELEYNRFLEEHCGKKLKRKVIFEGEELDLCRLFNGVKRFGGYDKVVNHKKWGDVSRFLRSGKKISECAKHVLCQLYREHLYDYEQYYNRLNKVVTGKGSMRGVRGDKKRGLEVELSSCSKRRRKNDDNEKVKVCKKVEIEEDFDQICEQCRSGLHGEVMLLCDRCNKGWHIYCLSPPLKQVPPGNWYCFDCLNSDKETFGFVPGKRFTVEAFKRVADRIRKKWFGSGSTSLVQLEKKFWEIVEGSAGEVEVIYGSDLDTSIYGSGFPRVSDQRPESVGAEVWEEYCGIPWNLNNLPKLKGSMLRAVHQNITGVMVPWLYVGMLFSSFCWHFEDHCFYSMNYLHWGEPKCWYSVPGSKASAFEEVMRSSLPDLFEAQPDLLFQLVTMLNPSVLQNHGVPVYSVLQEAGNFVITFPRSYHGGFNLGLNCAEAVNFAPADWLPHGGFGAELYQKYHKTAVLSHEELLCVVAKSDCDIKTSLHLKKELLRVYTKEKSWRERLWKSGIVKSSTMAPRKCPEFVGTEEDPTCMICKQQLYLSAVVCRCSPSVFVCLEHWEHICECKTSRLRLLYRYTLTELYDSVIAVDKLTFKDQSLSDNLQKNTSFSNELNCLTRKVNGGHVSLAQLAEQWLLRASNMFQSPCSRDACAALLKEAEQFLWAGSEMDPVRYMVKNLIAAQKWAGGIRKCLSKIQKFYNDCNHERVQMEYIVELLNFDPLPCNEPGHLKLKEHADEARQLVVEIDSALSSFSKVSELESLYSRVQRFPIHVKESEKLLQKISSVKVWIDSARRCISERRFAAVGVELLYKLKAEISGLQVQLPETEMLLDLLRQAELCQAQCSDILKSPCSLKGVEMLLKELDNFPVNVPELMLLKQCHADVVSWIARYNDVSANAQEREDQDNVVGELNCLMKDGASLIIQVDELPLLEGELKKACCRGKALKARDTKMPMDFIEHLIVEATVLQIEEEKLFVQLSGVLAAAIRWEERATKVLACGAQMSEFEDILRSSADIFAILPSLDDVADTISSAKSWLKSSAPFLVSSSSLITGPCSLLKLDVLKELVSQSKALKISLDEPKLLEKDLKKCEEWILVACSVLQEAACVLDASSSGDGKGGNLITEIEDSVSKLESITESGLSLGLDFLEIPKLQDVCSILRWCIRTLSFCSDAPSIEDAESLMVAAESLSVACGSWPLWSSLIDGVKWLRKALKVISKSSNFGKWKLSDAEEVLAESKCLNISFPLVVDQLTSAILKHRSWQEQAGHFLSLDSDKRYWSLALELKEHGQVDAFSCKELDIILSEVGKVENWKQQCMEIVGNAVDNRHGLLGALEQVKQSLDFSLNIYDNSWSCRDKTLCISCTACIEDQEFQTCSTCNDSYHLRCLDPVLVSENNGLFICHYCHFAKDGSIFQDGAGPLISVGRRPELGILIELLSDANKISIGIEERDALQHVVEQALKYRTCLREILDLTLSYVGMDASAVSKKLAIALKARKVAGVEDRQSECDLVLASARNCWRVRVNRLLEGIQKPTLQQIQRHVKMAVAMSIPPEDCLWKKLTELKCIGLQWAEQAKKVAADSGVLSLEKVYELILEGENLPIYLEKELELLRARSMLYCICRKPYDRREKVTCDWCGEWYHLDCIKLFHSPKTYVCAACKPQTGEPSAPPLTDLERTLSLRFVEPKTPSPRHTNSKKKADKDECGQVQEKLPLATNNSVVIRASGIDELWWRNRKPFRRAAKKRADLQSLSPFFHAQQQQQQQQT